MSTPFYYSTTYLLDKSHFSETFDESITADRSIKAYSKSVFLVFAGIAILYFTDIFPYAGWFIIVLGGVDAFSIYFRKPWWLARQMISEAANTKLTLTIDDNGVSSKSFSVESKISWADIKKIEQTSKGWLLHHASGRNYLSSRCLSEAAIQFIRNKANTLKSL